MKYTTGVAWVVALACIETGALAQPAEPATSDEPAAVEQGAGDIVVTARSRAENLQDVPDSISVLTSDLLETAGIDSIDTALDYIPNVNLVSSQDPGTVQISIRGIGQVRLGEPPVAINVDGVQLTSSDQITQAMFDVERIEVLKGPQGALYGRNAIGGAINITTREAEDDLEGAVQLEYANGDDRKAVGSLTGAIIPDVLKFRVSAFYRDFDGVLTNVTLDRKVDFAEEVGLRGRLIFTPTDRLSIDVRGSYNDLDSGASWYIPVTSGNAEETSEPIQANELGIAHRSIKDASLKADYEFDPFIATSITAFSDVDLFFFEDLDWFADPILSASQRRDTSAFTQELRLTSHSDQALRWTAGAFYLDSRRFIDTILLLGEAPFTAVPVTRVTDDSRGLAAFAQVNYDLLPELELTGALRYDNEKKTQTDRLGLFPERSTTFDSWQPKISLAYDATDDVMVYATFAQGFRSGGFNPPGGLFPAIYEAEETTNYEIGVKSTLADGDVRLNAAGFITKFSNQQVFVLRTASQGIINIDNTIIRGLEADFLAIVAPGLQLSGSVGLIDSEIEDFDGSDTFKGNAVPLTPAWSYTLAAQYSHPFSWGEVTARVDYFANGDLYWHVDNADKRSSLHLVNARVTADLGSYRVGVWAENLFDTAYNEEFFAQEFSGLLSDIRFPGTPRRYGITFGYRF